MNIPTTVADMIGRYATYIDEETRKLFAREPHDMYGMMEYFMGYADEQLRPVHDTRAGKRFRSGLCLFLADQYGALEKAMPVAVSIEVFHNFTLIHDDIVDGDELRRGRPTVWKLWGVNHAINTGDAQLLLSLRALGALLGTSLGKDLFSFLSEKYLEVTEGQHIDFALEALPLDDLRISQDTYLEMIRKKTSVLVGAATRAAGIVAGIGKDEQEALWNYGVSLGLAYQLRDDAASIWSTSKQTGKMQYGDIRERKKTLPIIYARDTLPVSTRADLVARYAGTGPMDEISTLSIIELLKSVNAQGYIEDRIQYYRAKAMQEIEHLSFSEDSRQALTHYTETLLGVHV